jgi:adenylate cyclase
MSRLNKSLTAGLLVGLLGLASSLLPVGLDLEENIALDILFKLRGTREAPPEVIIVTMDQVSAKHLNLPTDTDKWPRFLHARLTEKLAKQGASVIAFDIMFHEARSKENDQLFAQAISNASNVVLCECIKKETVPLTNEKGVRTGNINMERVVPPIHLLARSAVASAPFPLPKVPVKVSQYWTFKTGAGDKPTLPVVVFHVHALKLYNEFIRLLEKINLSLVEKFPSDQDAIIGSKSVEKLIRVMRNMFQQNPLIAERMLEELQKTRAGPDGMRKNQVLRSLIKTWQGPNNRYLNFYGPPGTIPTLPYYQVLQSHEESAVNPRQLDLHDKAVFVGASEQFRWQHKDGFYTVFSQPDGTDISGVEIAATAFANLLEDRPVEPLSFHAHIAIMLLWGMVLGVICCLLPTGIATGCVIGLSAIYLIVAQYEFAQTGSWYPLVFPLFFQAPLAFLGTLLWKYFETNKERENIKKAFGYYLPANVVDQVANKVADIRTSSQIVFGTCLFSDAGQYTKLSETMEPKELSSLMDKYYEVLFGPVKRYGGIVINVVGDSMVAVWSASAPDAALRNQACFAALDINSNVHQFNKSSKTLELPIRIGLHTGQILLGTVGAVDHYEYRPTGDIVNTASRMEGLNKYLGTRILVSEEVLHQLDGFLTRELGKFLFLGKSKPVVVHELICRVEESTEEQKRLCAIFTEALNAYRRQSWDEAIQILREPVKICGRDGPSMFYFSLCKKYMLSQPGELWDGLVRLEYK